MNFRIAIAAVLLSVCTAVQAQEEAPPKEAPPKVHRQGGSTYVSGGATDEARKALFKLAPKYPMQLIFQVNGEVAGVTGVKVKVKDLSGDVLVEAVSEGPYFYVNPPAGGRFTVDAEYQGETQSFTKDLVGRRYLVLEYKFTAK